MSRKLTPAELFMSRMSGIHRNPSARRKVAIQLARAERWAEDEGCTKTEESCLDGWDGSEPMSEDSYLVDIRLAHPDGRTASLGMVNLDNSRASDDYLRSCWAELALELMPEPKTASQARAERLLPNGIPRYVRLYDNGGETADRYTAVFCGHYRRGPRQGFSVLGMSENPYTGTGGHEEYPYLIDRPGLSWPPKIGRSNHLGKRIRFEDLPEPCRRAVLSDYRELWNL